MIRALSGTQAAGVIADVTVSSQDYANSLPFGLSQMSEVGGFLPVPQ